MASSFGTSVPALVFYRIHREGAVARVRVHVGETSGSCVGELALRPSEFRLWRATLHQHAPDRMSIWYGEGVFEWLHGGAA